MSKIALSGNASGTGTLTIAAPNTNSDRTLTLPDASGTVITTATTTGIDASALSTGTVAAARLGSGTANSTTFLRGDSTWAVVGGMPSGSVIYFASSTPPTGYLKANGAAVSRTTYAALFSAIGTTFGSGDGSTTFNVPDLRGEFPRGWDDGRGVDSGRAFGSAQADEFKSHTHDLRGAGGGLNNTLQGVAGAEVVTSLNKIGGALARGGTETRPRNIALLACIKF